MSEEVFPGREVKRAGHGLISAIGLLGSVLHEILQVVAKEGLCLSHQLYI